MCHSYQLSFIKYGIIYKLNWQSFFKQTSYLYVKTIILGITKPQIIKSNYYLLLSF